MQNFKAELFGTLADGREVCSVTFSDDAGNAATVISYGAILKNLFIKDRSGSYRDVVLGCGTLDEYVAQTARFGSTMGRSTSRIANARFNIDGREYILSENRKGFHMHGGFEGFDKKLWDYSITDDRVVFTYISPDGEEGYPGNLAAKVSYYFDRPGSLCIEYECVSDKDTVINLTNHSYFNLNGHISGSIHSHKLMIDSVTVAKLNEDTVPNGEFMDVSSTPLDFSALHEIGERINDDYASLRSVNGYDHNYVFPSPGMKHMAQLLCEESGIKMDVFSDLFDLGLYTANFLPQITGKDGALYHPYDGVCLETQFIPNSVNFKNYSPVPVYRAGEKYHFITKYCFSL